MNLTKRLLFGGFLLAVFFIDISFATYTEESESAGRINKEHRAKVIGGNFDQLVAMEQARFIVQFAVDQRQEISDRYRDDPRLRDEKLSGYYLATAKILLHEISGKDVLVVQTWKSFPEIYVQVNGKEALARVLSNPNVVAVYPNSSSPFPSNGSFAVASLNSTLSSMDAIDWTTSQAAVDTAAGVTVAHIDTGLNFKALGCEAPSARSGLPDRQVGKALLNNVSASGLSSIYSKTPADKEDYDFRGFAPLDDSQVPGSDCPLVWAQRFHIRAWPNSPYEEFAQLYDLADTIWTDDNGTPGDPSDDIQHNNPDTIPVPRPFGGTRTGHGTANAAIMLNIAPDIEIVSMQVGGPVFNALPPTEPSATANGCSTFPDQQGWWSCPIMQSDGNGGQFLYPIVTAVHVRNALDWLVDSTLDGFGGETPVERFGIQVLLSEAPISAWYWGNDTDATCKDILETGDFADFADPNDYEPWQAPGLRQRHFSALADSIARLRDHNVVVVAPGGNEARKPKHLSGGGVPRPRAISIGSCLAGYMAVGASYWKDYLLPVTSRNELCSGLPRVGGKFSDSAFGDSNLGPRKYQPTCWSNSGEALDILAPGKDIVVQTPNGYQYSTGGTSAAGPHVAAAAAVLRSVAPDATAEQIEQLVQISGVPVTDEYTCADNDPGCEPLTHSFVQLGAAVELARRSNWARRIGKFTRFLQSDVP